MRKRTIRLDDSRPPISYSVRITHHASGEVEIVVMDLEDGPTIRRDVALDLVQAAKALDPGIDLAAIAQDFEH